MFVINRLVPQERHQSVDHVNPAADTLVAGLPPLSPGVCSWLR
jgi:hypothetical protein